MDISKLSVEQLKTMAYDEMRRMTLAQNNLRIIEEHIAKKEAPNDKAGDKGPSEKKTG